MRLLAKQNRRTVCFRLAQPMFRVRVATVIAVLAVATVVTGQELEPRAYSPSPVGITFVVVGLTRSAGGVLVDPSLPVEDVNAKFVVAAPAVGHTFGIAGKQSLLVFALPVSHGSVTGKVGETRGEVTRNGLADPRVKLSINLAGSPALKPAEFARAPRTTVVGTSLTVIVPVGQYDRTKL